MRVAFLRAACEVRVALARESSVREQGRLEAMYAEIASEQLRTQHAEASAAKLSELEVRQSGWERTRGQQSSKRALYTVKNARNTPKSIKNALNTLL